MALAFSAGAAFTAGGIQWCATLLLLLGLLRPRWPFPRPAAGVVAVGLLVLAGALYTSASAPRSISTGPSGPTVAGSTGGAGGPTAPGLADREAIQEALARRVGRVFPTEGAMVEALLLARRHGLDRSVRDAFGRTGAAHLLAISGFHVGLLAGWWVLLLRSLRLSRGVAAGAAAGSVWLYVALLGFPVSAVRAALLLTALAVGRVRGRPVQGVGAWASALLLILLADPWNLARAGTQLSFAGALGLLVWARPWAEALRTGLQIHLARPVLPRWIAVTADALAASLAAQAATLPIVVWHFQQVPVLGLPATLLATPLISLALPGALLALAAESVGGPGWSLLASGVEGLLWLARRLLGLMAGTDPGLLLGPDGVAAGVVGALLVRRLARIRAPMTSRVGSTAVALGAVIGVLVAPLIQDAFRRDTLEVHVLDVGQGDAIAVQAADGRWMLVDTGAGSGRRLVRDLLRLGVRRLDLLVLTHPDLDHMGAAAGLLQAIPVGAVADGGVVRGTEVYRELVQAAQAHGVPWRRLARGDRWRWSGLEVAVLHPGGPGQGIEARAARPSPNDRSVVLQVSWGEFDLLLTGDISAEVELSLLEALGPVEVLKVAHHGSATSTAASFLDAVSPSAAVISVGRDNRFGHPAPSVLFRLRQAGVPVHRTDRSGALSIRARRDGSFRIRGEGPDD